MKKIDENDQVVPKGFSMRLGFTITVLLLALLIGSILSILGEDKSVVDVTNYTLPHNRRYDLAEMLRKVYMN